MQEAEFKIGDKVRVISIPGVDIADHPEMLEKIYTVQSKIGKLYLLNDQYRFTFTTEDLKLSPETLKLKGHLWLIISRFTGKVVEGYETRKEARENLNSNYDFSKNFKIVKYSF